MNEWVDGYLITYSWKIPPNSSKSKKITKEWKHSSPERKLGSESTSQYWHEILLRTFERTIPHACSHTHVRLADQTCPSFGKGREIRQDDRICGIAFVRFITNGGVSEVYRIPKFRGHFPFFKHHGHTVQEAKRRLQVPWNAVESSINSAKANAIVASLLFSFEKDPRVDESRAGPLSQRNSIILRRKGRRMRRDPWEEREDRGKHVKVEWQTRSEGEAFFFHFIHTYILSCGFEVELINCSPRNESLPFAHGWTNSVCHSSLRCRMKSTRSSTRWTRT